MKNTIAEFVSNICGGVFLVHNIEYEENIDGIKQLDEIYFDNVLATTDEYSVSLTFDGNKEYKLIEEEICDVSTIMGDLVIILEDFRQITITG